MNLQSKRKDSNTNHVQKTSIALYGASGVGKTGCINRFVYDDFADMSSGQTMIDTKFVHDFDMDGDLHEISILDSCGMEGAYDNGFSDDVFNYSGFFFFCIARIYRHFCFG